MRELTIDKGTKGQRLDKFLMKYMNKAPKSFVYKMLRKKNIKLNSKKGRGKRKCFLTEIRYSFSYQKILLKNLWRQKVVEKKQNRTFFSKPMKDENVLVVSKPVGLLVHPDKENRTGTLNDQLLYYLNKKMVNILPSTESVLHLQICNRLDRNTSGLVVMGKKS